MYVPGRLVFFYCPDCYKNTKHVGCGSCLKDRDFVLTATGAQCSCGNHVMRVRCSACGGVAMREQFFQFDTLEQEQAHEGNFTEEEEEEEEEEMTLLERVKSWF